MLESDTMTIYSAAEVVPEVYQQHSSAASPRICTELRRCSVGNALWRGRGYTMVELLIAFGVFGLFFTALFSFFRMGTTMFSSGSWKLTRQKETQRFLEVLKERLEQASSLSRINPAATPASQIMATATPLFTIAASTTIDVAGLVSPQKILLFSINKPDMSAVPGGKRGLCYGQALWASKNTLELFGSSNLNAASLSSSVGFPPDTATLIPGGDFGAAPSVYQLGGTVMSMKLTDVKQVEVSWGTASGTGQAEAGKVWSLRVDLEEPKWKKTTITHSIQARIAYDVPVIVPGGGL